MRPLLVFDLLGTLQDPSALDAVMGGSGARAAWWTELTALMLAAAALHEYRPFEELAAGALAMTGNACPRAPVLDALRDLPVYPEVPASLARLQAAGFRLCALTNGPPPPSTLDRFVRSVETAAGCERYKPDVQVYRNALARLDVLPADAIMVTAHAWDVAGAQRLGMRTAFVQRPGCAPAPWQHATLSGSDLGAVADALIFFPLTSGAA